MAKSGACHMEYCALEQAVFVLSRPAQVMMTALAGISLSSMDWASGLTQVIHPTLVRISFS